MRHPLRSFVAAAFAAVLSVSVHAQSYPSKPVRIMVGATPGGGTDVIARMLAEKFAVTMKQPFVVENRPGAANTIAADFTAKAAPDGHTLLVATNTGQAIAPHLMKLGFDPLKDLQPIGMILVVPHVLLVNSQETARDVKELVAKMKAQPTAFNYASSGPGSTQHIAGEAFNMAAGTSARHVPYKGSSVAHLDLLSGQVQIMLDTTSSAMQHIKSGKLRALAITSARRSPELPQVPTMVEAGYPSVEMSTWYGLFVTKGTPQPIVEKLHVELKRALALQEVQNRLRGLGGEHVEMTLEQFEEMNRSEFERFGNLIRAAKIKLE